MDIFDNFELEQLIKGVISTILIVVVAIFSWYLLRRAFSALERRSKLSKTRLVPLRLLARYGILAVSLLLIISAWGIPIGNFWTFVSTLLGLIAIGFVAVWSVLSNISATFFLLLFHPFRVGDYIRLVGDDAKGVVIDINFMYTTIRSLKGDVFTVPNNQFFQKTIMRPVDRERFELEDEAAKTGAKEKSADHSQQNLEGLKNPPPANRGHR